METALETPRHFHFKADSFKDLPLPAKGKKDYYQDSKEDGLELIVTHTGRMTFYLYRKFRGRPIRVRIGKYPERSITYARTKAKKYKGLIADGIDPRIEAPSVRGGMTLRQLFDEFNAKKKLPKEVGGKITWKEDAGKFNRYLTAFAHRKIDGISRNEIEDLHTEIGLRAPVAANRLVALLSAMFNYAIRRGHLKSFNPASLIKAHTEKQRTRYLADDEIARFMLALDGETNRTFADIFSIALFTGARRANVLSMRWEEINWSEEVWTIPKTKNGDEFTIPLYREVVEILHRRKASQSSPWVFASHSKAGHVVEVKSGLKRVLERAEIDNIRFHDLRRSFATILTNNGVQFIVIKHALGHRAKDVTMGYARVDLATHRKAIETAGNHIVSCVHNMPSSQTGTSPALKK